MMVVWSLLFKRLIFLYIHWTRRAWQRKKVICIISHRGVNLNSILLSHLENLEWSPSSQQRSVRVFVLHTTYSVSLIYELMSCHHTYLFRESSKTSFLHGNKNLFRQILAFNGFTQKRIYHTDTTALFFS